MAEKSEEGRMSGEERRRGEEGWKEGIRRDENRKKNGKKGRRSGEVGENERGMGEERGEVGFFYPLGDEQLFFFPLVSECFTPLLFRSANSKGISSCSPAPPRRRRKEGRSCISIIPYKQSLYPQSKDKIRAAVGLLFPV
jgi:hypothetical protein